MGGKSGGGDSGEQVQLQDQSVWGTQGDALGGMYNKFGNVFQNTNRSMKDITPDALRKIQRTYEISNPSYKDQLAGGVYNGMDLQGQYQDALGGGGNEQFINSSVMGGEGNNYADAMRSQIMGNAEDQQNQMMRGVDARANAAGMSGGSGQGLAMAKGMEDINQQATDAMTNVGYNTFDKDLQRKMDIARRADTFDMNKLQNISGMLGQQQNTMNQGLSNASGRQDLAMGSYAPFMAPYEPMGSYANAVGRPTVLTNSSMQGGGGGGGGGKGVGSTLGGIAGGFFGGSAGAAAGSAAGGYIDS